jgi:hypothetical protein
MQGVKGEQESGSYMGGDLPCNGGNFCDHRIFNKPILLVRYMVYGLLSRKSFHC